MEILDRSKFIALSSTGHILKKKKKWKDTEKLSWPLLRTEMRIHEAFHIKIHSNIAYLN